MRGRFTACCRMVSAKRASIWEALLFARHRKLGNFVVLVDVNGLQGFGSTAEVASLELLASKIRGVGLRVEEIDSHAPEALDAALRLRRGEPLVVVLRTVKGHGVSFMEGRMEWHYLAMNEAQYHQALQDVAQTGGYEASRASTHEVGGWFIATTGVV
jgi:transketolase